MEFAEITEDPFTNNTNNYFLVIDIQNYTIPISTGPGAQQVTTDLLADPSGVNVTEYWKAWYQDVEVTGSLSDEAYAHSYFAKREWLLIPPKFTFKTFGAALGFWLSPKEVEQFILGRLSLKGGD